MKRNYNMDSNKVFAGILVSLVLVGFAFVGWVMNIFELIHATTLTGLTVVRGIGVILWPIGAVMGYF